MGFFDDFHKKTNGKQKPGLLSGVLTASTRRDIRLFGGVPDPRRRAWTRPHGGYKTKEQVDRDVARCQEYLDAHEPPHTGRRAWVRPAVRGQRRPAGEQGRREDSPEGENAPPPAPQGPPPPMNEEASAGSGDGDEETGSEDPQPQPAPSSNAGAGNGAPPGPVSGAASAHTGPRRGPGSAISGPQRRPGRGTDAGSQRGGPRRPPGPVNDAGPGGRNARRPGGGGGNRSRPQSQAAANEEVELFDEHTTADEREDNARPYYASYNSRDPRSQQGIAVPSSGWWPSSVGHNASGAANRRTSGTAYMNPNETDGDRTRAHRPREGVISPTPSDRARVGPRGSAHRENQIRSEAQRLRDPRSELARLEARLPPDARAELARLEEAERASREEDRGGRRKPKKFSTFMFT